MHSDSLGGQGEMMIPSRLRKTPLSLDLSCDTFWLARPGCSVVRRRLPVRSVGSLRMTRKGGRGGELWPLMYLQLIPDQIH